jgi:hypothetical protein
MLLNFLKIIWMSFKNTPKTNIQQYEILRFSSQKESTLGLLFDITNGREFLCFTLEDQHQSSKIKGETRIPAGTYKLGLRKVGGFHTRYSSRFPKIHKGMIEVLDVPNFTFILWHLGNDDNDTEGCLLLGDSADQNITKRGFIGNSSPAYTRVYPKIADALSSGVECLVTYKDFDNLNP